MSSRTVGPIEVPRRHDEPAAASIRLVAAKTRPGRVHRWSEALVLRRATAPRAHTPGAGWSSWVTTVTVKTSGRARSVASIRRRRSAAVNSRSGPTGVSHHCRNVSRFPSRRGQLRDLGHVLPSNLLDLQRESSHPRGRAVHHHSRLLGLITCVIEFVFQRRPLVSQSRLTCFRVFRAIAMAAAAAILPEANGENTAPSLRFALTSHSPRDVTRSG